MWINNFIIQKTKSQECARQQMNYQSREKQGVRKRTRKNLKQTRMRTRKWLRISCAQVLGSLLSQPNKNNKIDAQLYLATKSRHDNPVLNTLPRGKFARAADRPFFQCLVPQSDPIP